MLVITGDIGVCLRTTPKTRAHDGLAYLKTRLFEAIRLTHTITNGKQAYADILLR